MFNILFYVACVILPSVKKAEEFRESGSGFPGTSYKKWTWTNWFDTDSGEHDIETYEAIVARGWYICKEGKLVGSECLRDDTGQILSDGYSFNTTHLLGVDLQCKLNGIECLNVRCVNFKVRFLCEEEVLESGSAVFYFMLLILPVIVILFRLYCWNTIKRRIQKRHNIVTRNTSPRNPFDVIDLSVFDPPAYDDLFGSQMAPVCTICNHMKSENKSATFSESFSVHRDCSCICHGADVHTTSGSESNIQSHGTSSDVNIDINDVYIHDNNDITGANRVNNTALIYIVSNNSDQNPPPSYSEALVILKRAEGLDATHL